MTDIQTTVHTEPPDDHFDYGSNVDAHMPPQPGPAVPGTVWNEATWNPETNEWAPSNEQHDVWGVAEPSHGDDPDATPQSDSPGIYSGDGSVPAPGMTLLDSVKLARRPLPPPPIEHHHVVETQDQAASQVRLRLVAVVGNTTSTVIADQNPNRDRMLIKVFTAGSTILLTPLRQGGAPQLTAAVAAPGAFWPLATADGTLEIKSTDGVEAVGITAGGTVLVQILEEINSPSGDPGLI